MQIGKEIESLQEIEGFLLREFLYLLFGDKSIDQFFDDDTVFPHPNRPRLSASGNKDGINITFKKAKKSISLLG